MASTRNWKDGEIAFLKGVDQFNHTEYRSLIASGYMREATTQHPVIVLEHSSDYQHYLITTVSAYGSSRENSYLAPWRQACHRRKCRESFRAFFGSEKPSEEHDYLWLEPGQQFPKPKTSWVYIRLCFVVPASTLTRFDKTPTQLRVTQESLKALLRDMRKLRGFDKRWTDPRHFRLFKLKHGDHPALGKAVETVPSTNH
ncbi:hypothetical protein GGS23DRAFT_594103 [Durotheca rogersii]|uniref:uncharacterized protein n=1 Tax=Durotheca rogersii TaxID=419775 RepID=UPI0022209301|nr:uncharacterized protein GGS23DRAFT_594103 [Durotheca rogersii]KAI5865947.1 hypothetical protein GGS23DRAFT_594103 [Durotheca rogersii]